MTRDTVPNPMYNGVNRPMGARIRSLIEVDERIGAGTHNDPVRVVQRYYDHDGNYVAQHDAWWDTERVEANRG